MNNIVNELTIYYEDFIKEIKNILEKTTLLDEDKLKINKIVDDAFYIKWRNLSVWINEYNNFETINVFLNLSNEICRLLEKNDFENNKELIKSYLEILVNKFYTL